MKFFLDTANLKEIQDAASLGIIDGVTTNPTLVSRESKTTFDELAAHYLQICSIVDGPISAEVIATDHETMVKEAKNLADIHKNIVVKIPATLDGLKSIAYLNKIGIKTNCTLIFSLRQAILAMKAGASYVSPFIGRLEDNGQDGLNLVKLVTKARDTYHYKTEIISTSIRHIYHVEKCMEFGADIATCPYRFLISLVEHPLTDKGLEIFLSDFNSKR